VYNENMKITFKDIRDGLANKVFVDGKFIGIVEVHSWPKTWRMRPVFHYNHKKGAVLAHTKYDSCYEAGKALVKLHENTFNNVDEEDITDEIDMRDVFKTIGFGP
jgi:hypothetical protein